MYKKIRHYLGIRFRTLRILSYEFSIIVNHLGSNNLISDKNKLRSKIIMETHVLEKGLSLKNVKIGFGVPKVLALLKLLEKYSTQYNDRETLVFALSVIDKYIEFNKGNGCINNLII